MTRFTKFSSLLAAGFLLLGLSAFAKETCQGMSQTEMIEKTREILASNKNITEEQRAKMMELFNSTMGKMAVIRQDMTKSKKALFEALMSKKEETSKIRALRQKLVQLNSSKMDTMFDSMEQAKTILGKNTSEEVFQFMDFETGRGVY